MIFQFFFSKEKLIFLQEDYEILKLNRREGKNSKRLGPDFRQKFTEETLICSLFVAS